MKFKQLILNILVIIASFSLFVIWYNKNIKEAIPATVTQNQDYKIYLITKDKVFQYWTYMNQGVGDMASMLGLTYQWEGPEISEDISQQIEIFNQAVSEGTDAILISVIDAQILSDPIKNAKEKGVKIIYVDTPANEEAVTTLATDNYAAGKIAAENMIEELELLGIETGKLGIIGVNTTVLSTMQRERGIRDKIAEDGRYALLDTVYSNGDPIASQEAATSMITANKNLVGLFGTNEGTSVGVGNAIKADKNRITGIGFDKSDIIMNQLNDGSFKAIIAQNPYTMGYLGMAEAYAALKGYDIGPKYIDTGVSVLRKR